MSKRGALHATLALILLLAAVGVASSEEALVFVSPDRRVPLIGKVVFAFDVSKIEARVESVDVFVGGTLVGTALPPDWKVSWDAGEAHVGQVVVAVAYDGDSPVARTSLETLAMASPTSVEVQRVQHYPVVTDRLGRYVPGLTIDDFIVLEEGKPVRVKEFSTGDAPVFIAMVIDISASMESVLGFVKGASCRFLDRLGPHDRVAVYAFNQGAVRLAEAEGGFESAKKAIRGLRCSGGTALYDALQRVLGDLLQVRGRKAVLVYSDGKDESSATSLLQVVQSARATEAMIYAVGSVGGSGDSRKRDDLLALTEATGGRGWYVSKSSQIEEAYSAALRELRSQYILSYRPPPGPAGARRVEIRTRNPRLRVRHRKSYMHRQ